MFGLIVAVLDVIALVIIGVPLYITGSLGVRHQLHPEYRLHTGRDPPALIALLDGGIGSAIAVVAVLHGDQRDRANDHPTRSPATPWVSAPLSLCLADLLGVSARTLGALLAIRHLVPQVGAA
jgi:hypothetical protein